MYEINPFLRGANKATDAMTRKVMNAFARNYESAVNEMFNRLHEEEYKQLCKDETFASAQTSTLERMAQEEQSQKFFDMTAPQMRYAPDYTSVKDFSSIIEKSYSDNVKPNMSNPYKDEDSDSENTNSEQIRTKEFENNFLKAEVNINHDTITESSDTLPVQETLDDYHKHLVEDTYNQNATADSSDTSPEQGTFDDYRRHLVEGMYNQNTVKYKPSDNSPVTNTKKFEYNPQDYQRLAFNDRASVVMFLKEMKEQGVSAVAP